MSEVGRHTTTRAFPAGDKGGYAEGGIVSGAVTVNVQRVDDCANGHSLYVIDGGRPEHIVGAAEARSGDYAQIRCQDEIDRGLHA